jgi:P27 family predicted phage terminase small subunit
MPGPARKPTELKELEGTTRKDRTNVREPRPLLLGSADPPPAWLRGRAARLGWREALPMLTGMRVATIADRVAVGLLCEAFGRWLDARTALAKRGSTTYTTETESGSVMHREFPEVGQVERAWKQVLEAAKEFGMTPASRSKVNAVQAGSAKPAPSDLDPFEAWQQRAANDRPEARA